MIKVNCTCGHPLANEHDEDRIEYTVFTKSEWQEILLRIIEETPLAKPASPRLVLKCPNCNRIYIWDADKSDPVVYAMEGPAKPRKPRSRGTIAQDFEKFQQETGVLLGVKSSKHIKSFRRDLSRFLICNPPGLRSFITIVIYKYLMRDDNAFVIFKNLPDVVRDRIIIFIDSALIADYVWDCGYDITNIEQNYWGNRAAHNDGVDCTDRGLPEWYEPTLKKMRAITPRQRKSALGGMFLAFIEDFED